MAENIVELLTDVADAIREKKGTTDKINAQNFAEEIKNLPSGGEVAVFAENMVTDGTGIQVIKRIIIQEGVTTIVENAFYDLESPQEYVIPESVITIGARAFRNNKQLISVNIPRGLTRLTDAVFYGCNNLNKIELFDSISEINVNAFSGCYNMKTIIIHAVTPPELKNINAFSNQHADRLIYVPDTSVDAYKSATNWSTYADAISPLSELPNE